MSSSGDEAAAVLRLLSGARTTQIVYVMAELGLADLLEAGPRGAGELAVLTRTHEAALRKLLNALVAQNLCARDGDAYRLTPAGARLRSSDGLHAWALWWGRSLWQAWAGLLHSVRTGESAREWITGTPSFDHLAENPENAAIFYSAMAELSRLGLHAIVATCDFGRFSRVVDVGGGYGELLVAVLRANGDARGVLFDLPQATAGARAHLDTAGVGDRCDVVAGDFFVSVPAGGDAYVLKSVLHDWDDARAGRVLAACRRAMRADARLLLIEDVLPGPDEPVDAGAAMSDLNMLVALGAGERTLGQFAALLGREGFEIVQVVPLEGAQRIIEAVPTPSR